MRGLLTLDAGNGIGSTTSVLNAHTDGYWGMKESAKPSLITANHSDKMGSALDAIEDTN